MDPSGIWHPQSDTSRMSTHNPDSAFPRASVPAAMRMTMKPMSVGPVNTEHCGTVTQSGRCVCFWHGALQFGVVPA